jgi:hypothetical protein
MIRRPSKFLREIAAQMLVGFCTESTKGACQDTPPLPPTTSLQEDPSPQWYHGRSEDWSTTDEEKPQLSSKSPSPDNDRDPWAINSRKRWTHPQPTGGPEHPSIFKKTRPNSQGIWGSTTIVASLQHTKCGWPLVGSPHSKSNPSQSTYSPAKNTHKHTCILLLLANK